MTYELTIEQKPGFLHAVVSGVNSKENVQGYLDQILRECVKRKCGRVLIEENLEGEPLGLIDVFDITSKWCNSALRTVRAVAYVRRSGNTGLAHFAETVAANRALPTRFFERVADAEAWLTVWGPNIAADEPESVT
jgi:hypothetical protein